MKRTEHLMKKVWVFALAIAMTLAVIPVSGVLADDNVAKVGNDEYATITAAITAAQNNTATTITLLKDTNENVTIPANKNITLDLSGHKLTNSGDSNTITVANKDSNNEDSSPAILILKGPGTVDNTSNGKTPILNNGTTKIDDGVVINRSAEKGTFTPDDANGNSYYYLVNRGYMVINKATINSVIDANGTKGGHSSLIENGYFNYGNKNGGQDEPRLIINDGNFTGGKNTVKNDDGGILTINGGIFENTYQAPIMNWNEATINGGTFTAPKGHAAVSNGKLGDNDKGDLTITGGKFDTEYIINVNKDSNLKGLGDVTITGGNFTAATSIATPAAAEKLKTQSRTNQSDLAISGGTFSKTAASSIKEDQLRDENRNGRKYETVVDSDDNIQVMSKAAADEYNKRTKADKDAADKAKADSDKANKDKQAELQKKIDELQAEIDKEKAGVKMLRLYNPNSGEHFYTSDAKEAATDIAAGWKDEGTGWIAPKSGDPVYRLYNPNAGDHHYTKSLKEKNALVRLGWDDEGIGWYSGGDTPVYREYNPNAYANNHNYTPDKNEHSHLVSIGWRNEGIGWYAKAAK